MWRGDQVDSDPGESLEASPFGRLDFSFLGFVMVLPYGRAANVPGGSRQALPERWDRRSWEFWLGWAMSPIRFPERSSSCSLPAMLEVVARQLLFDQGREQVQAQKVWYADQKHHGI